MLIRLKFLLTLIGCFLIISCSRDSVVIYYVNPAKLLQGYHGATARHELFQARAKVWQQRVDSLGTELQALSKAPTTTHTQGAAVAALPRRRAAAGLAGIALVTDVTH